MMTRRPLRAIGRDVRGNVIIEFALVVPAFAALMVAILQTSLIFFAQQTLETATEKSVRQIITGAAQKGNLSSAQFKTSVCAAIPDFLSCSKLMIDVRTVTDFASASVAPPTITYDAAGAINNTWSYAPGGPGAITVVTVMYPWSVQRGPFGFDLATMSNNRRLLTATAVFKVEPYS